MNASRIAYGLLLLSVVGAGAAAAGTALRFGGSDAYVTFGNTSALGLTAFTIEAWFQRQGPGQSVSTGSGGVTGVPLVTKGRHETDGTAVDMNYFLGIGSNAVLVADFEEGAGGAVLGRNHPLMGTTQIQNGVWHHAAVTYDGTTLRLFLDGAQEAQLSVGQPARSDSIQHAALASGLSSTGAADGFFDGLLDEVRIWNVARSRQQIIDTMNQEVRTATGLVARWGLDEGVGTAVGDTAAGSSQNGTIVGSNWTWTSPGAPLQAAHPPDAPALVSPANGATGVSRSPTLGVFVGDSDGDPLTVTFWGRRASPTTPEFSVVALPDTQYYTSNLNGGSPAIFNAQTQWIVDNLGARNIAFVTHLGDCVEHGNNNGNDAEWISTDGAMRRIENSQATGLLDGIPYGVAVGNHDQSPDGSPDGASTTGYNRFFGVSRFLGRSYYGGHLGNNNDDHFELFRASGMDFIVIHLEYDTTPDAAVLAWAEGLLQTYPARRAIVVTHWAVNTGNPASFSAMGQAIYDRLKTYPNFFLMLGGHVCEEGRRRDVFGGNVVHTLLSDYQCRANGGDGWLRILRFIPGLDQIEVRTYSPTRNQFETDESSQFTLDYQMAGTPFSVVGTRTVGSGSSATVTWANLDPQTEYEWYAVASDGVAMTPGPLWRFTTAPGGQACTSAAQCDDANDCTADACVQNACVRAPRDGAACNDGNRCTQTDVCQGTQCIGSAPVVCAAADQCHAASCDPGSGTCVQTPRLDGSACTDGNPCTAGDACVAGTCVGSGCPQPAVEADLTVAADTPGTDFHTSPLLETDASPMKRIYLKVRTDGPEGNAITSARLRFQVANVSLAESDSGGRVHASGCDWDATTLTWNTQPNPPFDPAILASFDAFVTQGQVVQFDVTGAIRSGVHCFVIDSPSTNSVKYNSLEATTGRPELLLSTTCTCGPDSTTTSTTRPATTTTAMTSSTTTTTRPPGGVSVYQEGASGPTGSANVDTQLRLANAGSNYSVDPNMTVGVTTAPDKVHRTIIAFTLSDLPPGAVVTACQLRINVTEHVSPTSGHVRRLCGEHWLDGDSQSEAQATWNQWKTGTAWGVPGAGSTAPCASGGDYTNAGEVTYAPPAGTGVFTFPDLSALCQDAVAQRAGRLRLRLSQAAEGTQNNFFRFSSSDATTPANRPRLTVSWSAP